MLRFLLRLATALAKALLQIITGPAAALREIPNDILERTFQIAGLAMHAITEVHFYAVLLKFIDVGRAELRAGCSVVGNTLFADLFIFDQDMTFLLFVVFGAREIDIR